MKKYENFCNAFHNLKDIYDYNEPYTNVAYLAGMKISAPLNFLCMSIEEKNA